jgi:uncharacterized membrane protein
MRREVAWLHAELPELVERGVLTPDAADALRQHYGTPDRAAALAATSWGQILLASFGALLVGGGIILILAHNWDDLGRPARAAIAIGLLVVAQALCIYAVVKRSQSAAWLEASGAFLVASVGGALSLVGQTYHVGGSFEGLMRAWLWLVLLIPYASGSRLAAILFWALMLVRAANRPWSEHPDDPWFLVAAAAPFVIGVVRRQPRSWGSSLLAIAAAIAVFVVGTMITARDEWRGLWAVFQVSFVAAIIAAASWPPDREAVEAWRHRLLVPAWFALIVIGAILTFDDPWRPVALSDAAYRDVPTVATAIATVACAAFASVVGLRLARAGQLGTSVGVSAAVLVVVLHLLSMLEIQLAGWMVFNLWLLACGALTLVEGVRSQALGTANRGLVALAALIAVRFFDTDLSFLVRGLVFVGFGGACLVLNLWMMRRARRIA